MVAIVDDPDVARVRCIRCDALQLCAGMTDARDRTTTEVYPDSPRTDAETCIRAQVAAVTAAIDFALAASA